MPSTATQAEVAELKQRAEHAAAGIVAEHELAGFGVPYEVLLGLVAVGWVEGWTDAGVEHRELLEAAIAAGENVVDAVTPKGDT